jgi:translation initiation factor IF-2
MAETKPVRLSKAARELNVGIQTIVEYLDGQGIQIDGKPTTKLEPETYALLLQEFQSDQQTKAQSSAILNRQREMRETITLESSKREVEEEQEPDVLDGFDAGALKTAQNKDAPIQAKKEVKAKPEPAPAIEKIQAEVEKPEVKVVAKVDLDKLNVKKKKEEKVAEPEAEKKEEKIEAPVETPAPEKKIPVEEAKPEPKAETAPEKALENKEPAEKPSEKPKEESLAKADIAEEAAPAAEEEVKAEDLGKEPKTEDGIFRASASKLSGPTVVGKIKLPEKPKPVASSSDTDSDMQRRKRKRKRIAKVDVSKQAKDTRRKGGKPGNAKPEITEASIQKEIKETLARLSGKGKNKGAKLRRQKRDAVAAKTEAELERLEAQKSVLQLTEFVTVSELSNMMGNSPTDIISACMSLGIFASINQRLDAETITIITEEFGFTVEFVSAEVQDQIVLEEDSPESLVARPPIVTVMGHVDHGKTSLLDYVRNTNVIGGEAGGITQHIGAYSVTLESGKKITFLDTPGHEAFTAMRARGAQATDLAIIVVAADDAVMPQTKEAISHAQAADIPMIFAINKIDRPNSNPDKIKEELSQLNILIEEWGGKYQSQDISAKTGQNIPELLEKVLLEAELLELKANPEKKALGTVVESTLDKGRGYVTTILVEGGTLRVGDSILAGQWSGRVKAMHNERGSTIELAGPATPVSILGMDGAPNAGDNFHVMDDEKEARGIALKRQQLQREQSVRATKHVTMEEIGRRIALGEFKELNLIVKGDVDGSVEALTDSLQKQSTEKVQVNVIHKAVGQISESDVLLATASDAIIIGFQVRPSASARNLAEKEGIQIRMYSVIYAAIDEMKEAMEGLLSVKIEEKVVGTAEVREVFKITKVGTIAGCFMLDGAISRNHKVRVIRDGIVVHTGTLSSLKRFKDDVKEVKKGFECGIAVSKFNDLKEGDNIEAFEEVEVKQTLDS